MMIRRRFLCLLAASPLAGLVAKVEPITTWRASVPARLQSEYGGRPLTEDEVSRLGSLLKHGESMSLTFATESPSC